MLASIAFDSVDFIRAAPSRPAMPETPETLFDELRRYAVETSRWSSIEQLLGWDERTMMPAADAEHRAEQFGLLSGLIHRRWTDPRLGELIEQLEGTPLATDARADASSRAAADASSRAAADASSRAAADASSRAAADAGATIRRLRRSRDRAVKLPPELVEELARLSVIGQQTWQAARRADDFDQFLPVLEKIVRLKRDEAEAVGYDDQPYDALLDEYEPDERTDNVARVLGELREKLVPLVAAIAESDRRPPREVLRRPYPTDAQAQFGRAVAEAIGFDFSRGRLDVTAHPFCAGVGPNDCRITTRYDERMLPSALFGILHEAGHGIYDQGLRTDQWGLPPGKAISLGIHESQSRLWENFVGRSRAFWERFYPMAQQTFPDALADVGLDDFHFAVNEVTPSLIRVEADEVTYNLHILARFELELALINQTLQPADLPGAWNEKYRQYLGIEPPSDADGVLQDVHWSGGAIGYFPTYALGNLYAAHWFAAAEKELGDLNTQFARGQFDPLRDWLRANIHEPGQCYSAAELLNKVTGETLSSEPLIAQLQAKFGPLYGLEGPG
jgi:carboxypeptidase Taq